VRQLFSTGFFKDVRIDTRGDVVVVVVQERPVIASLAFTGMREFDSKTILDSLRQVGFGEGRIFDQAMLEQAEFEIKQQYLSKGKYGVEITSTVTPLPRNRVGINFDIFEGEIAKIKEIKIVGDKAFSESTLLGMMSLTTSGWLTWYTDSDKYSREKLEKDMETIRSYYLDRGFLEYRMEPPQVTISPDRLNIFITLTISEGKPYKVSSVKLAGELLSLNTELEELIKIKAGEVFSGAKANETIKAIKDYLGGLGYAFANVNPNPVLDRDKQEAALTFFVDPSRRVYVRRIQITGNERTRDTVARREIKQLEAAWYNGGDLALSKEKLERTGYFQEVNLTTEPVPGTTDLVDVMVATKERQTGAINLGIGYGQADGVILSAGISEQNAFGSGNALTFQVNTSQDARTFIISHTNPYFTNSGISRSTSVYYRTVTPSQNNPGNYEVKTVGGGLTFGVPVTEFDRVSLGANFESNSTSLYSNSPLAYQQYVEQYGETTNSIMLNAGWNKDTRDSALSPTKGALTRVGATVGTLSLKYYLLSAQQQYFLPIGRDYTLAFNGLIDYGNSYSDLDYPVIKDVFAGGIGTVRGFIPNSLGPKDPITGTFLGGSKRVVGNMQFYWPFPGASKEKTLRLFAFTDAGQVYGNDGGIGDTSINLSDIRYSAGFGLSWLSPMGPLQLSYGKPLNQKEGDQT
ncbi:MAG: outer membrane protein assembly factor BamA, partial [Burkholderiaceae bacterium]|nr:outer membrane protein assembly factor BamA [Burkholderiaceae bacterium]